MSTPCGLRRELEGAADDGEWQRAREFAWTSFGDAIVRVPLTTPRVPALDAWLARGGAARRYALAGNVAFVSWPQPLDALSDALNSLGLRGQVLIGPPGNPFIGAQADVEFGRRVASVLDPDGRFRSN